MLMLVNDVWLKPRFHSALTGKLSDLAFCFVLPLFVSEVIGLVTGAAAPVRLTIGALTTVILLCGLKLSTPFAALVVSVLNAAGARWGFARVFRVAHDWTDLFCLGATPAAVIYGLWRLHMRAAPSLSEGVGVDIEALQPAVDQRAGMPQSP
jgi:hypothetical protein